MRLLLDTHLLIWAAGPSQKLSAVASDLINDPAHVPAFSVASLWEIAIKRGLGRDDFDVDPRALREGLIQNGYDELLVTSAHTFAVMSLPALHKDPFDRLLVAQATVESMLLLTVDARVAAYPGPVRRV